eukprot:COSAG06_NODE_5210_length_3637_cov_2.184285_3_plen_61_part_00
MYLYLVHVRYMNSTISSSSAQVSNKIGSRISQPARRWGCDVAGRWTRLCGNDGCAEWTLT